jgi:large subunit ribosomal protein L9
MKIILLKDVAKVGKKYDVKDMSDGYAQNLLIPKGLAIPASADALKKIEIEKARNEGEKKVHQDLLLKNLNELDGVVVSVTERANEKGHLFAAINKPEVVKAIFEQTRLQISEEHIKMDTHIKEIGVHVIEVKAVGKSIKFSLDVKGKK